MAGSIWSGPIWSGSIWSGVVPHPGGGADQNARREDRFPEADPEADSEADGGGRKREAPRAALLGRSLAHLPGRLLGRRGSTCRRSSGVNLLFDSSHRPSVASGGRSIFSPGPVTSASRRRIPGPRPPRVAPHRPPTRHPLPPVPRLPRMPRRRRFRAPGVHALGPSVGSSRIFLLPAPLPPPWPGWPPVRPCPHCWRPVFPDTFPRTRMACAVRYGAHSATAVYPGQEAISVLTGLSTEMCC